MSKDTYVKETFHPLCNFEQIVEFHEQFDVVTREKPGLPDNAMVDFRIKFLKEELSEFIDAVEKNDLPEMIDALVDLTVIAMGTADIFGFDWQPHWEEVIKTLMTKKKANHAGESKRGFAADIVKPVGWVGPDHQSILEKYS